MRYAKCLVCVAAMLACLGAAPLFAHADLMLDISFGDQSVWGNLNGKSSATASYDLGGGNLLDVTVTAHGSLLPFRLSQSSSGALGVNDGTLLGLPDEIDDLGLGTESIQVGFSRGVTLNGFGLEDFYMQTGWLSAWEAGKVNVYGLGGQLMTTVSFRATTTSGVETIADLGLSGVTSLEFFPDSANMMRNLGELTSDYTLSSVQVGVEAPPSSVPEPGSALLVAAGLGLAAWRRRRRQAAA